MIFIKKKINIFFSIHKFEKSKQVIIFKFIMTNDKVFSTIFVLLINNYMLIEENYFFYYYYSIVLTKLVK